MTGALQLIDTPNGSEICEWEDMELGNGRQNWQQGYQAFCLLQKMDFIRKYDGLQDLKN